MNRATRDKFAAGTDQTDTTGGNACWQTPPDVFADLHDRYHFDVDLFADAERALLPCFFGPGSPFAEDAFETVWEIWGLAGFSNPPYGAFIKRVLTRAAAAARNGFRSVHLIPMRFTVAVREALFRSRTVEEWLVADRRICFYENDEPRRDKKGTPMPALFDSTVLVFGPDAGAEPKVREWRVPDHVPTKRRKAA